MLVPKLRFGEFKDEWNENKFKNLITLNRGSSPRPIQNYITKDIKGINWIKIGDIAESEKYVTKTEEKITIEGSKKSRPVKIGEIILSNSMSYGKAYILKIDGCIHDGWFVLRNFEKTFNKDYLCFLLNSEIIQKQYRSLAAGGVVSNISSELVNSVIMKYPSKKEQEKIANFLSLLDQKIEMQNKKIETLKIYKTGLFNKIYEEKMKTIKEEEIKKYVYLQGGYAFKSKLFSKNGIPIIRIANINENIVDLKDIVFYNEKIEIDSKFEINTGDILIAMSGATTGKIGIYKEKTKSYLNQRIGKIVLKSEDIIYSYLYFLFELSSYNMQLNTKLVAGAQPNISPTDIETLKFKVPSIDMQEYISNIAMSMNKKIKIEEKKLQKLNNVKKSLLQQMFI